MQLYNFYDSPRIVSSTSSWSTRTHYGTSCRPSDDGANCIYNAKFFSPKRFADSYISSSRLIPRLREIASSFHSTCAISRTQQSQIRLADDWRERCRRISDGNAVRKIKKFTLQPVSRDFPRYALAAVQDSIYKNGGRRETSPRKYVTTRFLFFNRARARVQRNLPLPSN